MKYIALTFKNIKKFVVHHPVMFTLFIMVQVICCVAVFITCGMANNMYAENEKVDEYSTFAFNFFLNEEELTELFSNSYIDENGNEYFLPKGEKDTSDVSKRIYEAYREGVVPMPEMREKLEEFMSLVENKYTLHHISLLVYPNNKAYGMGAEYFATRMPNLSYDVPDLNKMYIDSNEKIIVAPMSPSPEYGYHIGETYEMNGYEYKCVAERKGIAFIPYNALDDNFVVFLAYFGFEDKLTQQNIDELSPIFSSLFDKNISGAFPPEPYEPFEVQLNQMVYVISLVVMVIILLAIAKFYNYVLSDRKNTLTILRLCGCTRGKVHIIYMLEIFLTMIVTSAIGFVLFKFVFFKGIAELYPSFKDFYTDIIYVAVLGAYIVLAMIIMTFTVIPSTKASITDMKRNR